MSIRQSIVARLFDGVDPFASRAGVAVTRDPAALPEGWGSIHPYFEKYIRAVRPGLIVEVGTWLGGSAIHMGHLLRANGLAKSCILCVDTWLGSSEHYQYAEGRATMKLVNGRPSFYEDFMQNVAEHGLQDIILPFSITGTGAAQVLQELEIVPDLVYLDGDHAARAFRADLDAYWELLRPGGAIIGDDFDWEGVQAEIINFAYLTKVEFTSFNNKFAVQKPA